jgi:hypothetical protein
VPIFLLVPQVKLPKRLDLATPSRRSTRSGADRGELGREEALNLVEACGSRVLRHLIDLPDQPSSVSHGVPALRQRPGCIDQYDAEPSRPQSLAQRAVLGGRCVCQRYNIPRREIIRAWAKYVDLRNEFCVVRRIRKNNNERCNADKGGEV